MKKYNVKEVQSRIEEAKSNNTDKLFLNNMGISQIPEEVFSLSQLKVLDLSGNDIDFLPASINKLSTLRELFLTNNKLKEIPVEITELSRLEDLHLTNNELESLPENIEKLRSLRRLFLTKNKFKKINKSVFSPRKIKHIDLDIDPTWQDNTIFLGDNPIENPPVQILNQGIDTTINYFDQQERQGTLPLHESKIILVGEPDAGKTSLMKKLINDQYVVPL